MINGTSWLVVTKLDVLDELAEIPVCIGYKIDGKNTSGAPAQASEYEKIECVYKKLPGWRTSTEGITEYSRLPAAAQGISGIHYEKIGSEGGHDLDRPRPQPYYPRG